MRPEKIQLAVVTPERHVLDESVESVELPAKEGFLGVLPGHAPLLTELGIGLLSYKRGAETKLLTLIHGFAEVLPDRVIVLADFSERAEEIDSSRAQTAAQRAQATLAGSATGDEQWQQASFALERAILRLQAAGKGVGYLMT